MVCAQRNMDKTALFMQLTKGHQELTPPRRPKSFNSNGSEFNSVATRVVTMITKMRCHLIKRAEDYLGIYSCLPGKSMSDSSREQLENDVETLIQVCNKKLNLLQSEVTKFTNSDQMINHRVAIVELVMRHLNDFVRCYSELRTLRVKRVIERQQMDRLEQISNKKESIDYTAESKNEKLDDKSYASLSSSITHDTDSFSGHRQVQSNDFNQTYEETPSQEMNLTLTQVQLQEENSAIHDELLSVVDEIKTIGSKVVQIAKLQQLFTERVMEQDVELSRLHDTAIRSSENVREGNELIRDAMMKNASTRAFFLFYIVTLGLTVLFLDWYNA